MAKGAGARRDREPAILQIDAAGAHAAGVAFFQADNGVFLAKHVPPEQVNG